MVKGQVLLYALGTKIRAYAYMLCKSIAEHTCTPLDFRSSVGLNVLPDLPLDELVEVHHPVFHRALVGTVLFAPVCE